MHNFAKYLTDLQNFKEFIVDYFGRVGDRYVNFCSTNTRHLVAEGLD